MKSEVKLDISAKDEMKYQNNSGNNKFKKTKKLIIYNSLTWPSSSDTLLVDSFACHSVPAQAS